MVPMPSICKSICALKPLIIQLALVEYVLVIILKQPSSYFGMIWDNRYFKQYN